MFRTSNLRGAGRFRAFQSFTGERAGKLSLTRFQIKLIEESEIISIGEKIELLLLVLGNKLTTELYRKINYSNSDNEQMEIASSVQLVGVEHLLHQLPFIYFQDCLQKINKKTNTRQRFIWYQVSINRAVSNLMQDFPDDMTEFEEGVLYGFPLSAIRAFSGLIEPRYDKPTAASYFLAGVLSKDFWQEELDYYEMWWLQLKKLSPIVVEEAEREFTIKKAT